MMYYGVISEGLPGSGGAAVVSLDRLLLARALAMEEPTGRVDSALVMGRILRELCESEGILSTARGE